MLGIVFLASLIIPTLKFKNDLDYQQIFLGAITALCGPCLVGNDFTPFYLISGLINSFAMIMALVILTILVILDHVVLSHPEALTTNVTANAFLNSTWSKISGEQQPFFISISCLIILWMISIGALVYLHKCLDPVKKFKYSKIFFKSLIYFILFVIFIIATPIILLALVIMATITLLCMTLDLLFGFWLLCSCGYCCLCLCHLEDGSFGFFTRNTLKFFKTQKR